MALKSPLPFDAAWRGGRKAKGAPAISVPVADMPLAAPLKGADAGAALPPEPPPPQRQSLWQHYKVFLSVMLSAALLLGGAWALWYFLPIRAVQVSGNKQLSELEVKRLAGLSSVKPFGWVYYGAWRAGALRDNAWIESATITRVFPDRIEIALRERVPVAQLKGSGGELTVVAADGTPLPGAAQTGPVISGWGPDRTADALFAASALSRYNVQSVAYTPTGITVHTAKGTIWSGDKDLLLKYASATETQAESGRVNLYPWGVSVQR